MSGDPYVAVIRSGVATGELYEKAREVGRLVAERGGTIVCGGLSGVMGAVARGAAESGRTAIGILPDEDRRRANEYLAYSIATGRFGPAHGARGSVIERPTPTVIARIPNEGTFYGNSYR